MIKGELLTPSGQLVLMFGLEGENIRRLQQDMPIRISIAELMAAGFDVARADQIVIYANAPGLEPDADKT